MAQLLKNRVFRSKKETATISILGYGNQYRFIYVLTSNDVNNSFLLKHFETTLETYLLAMAEYARHEIELGKHFGGKEIAYGQ